MKSMQVSCLSEVKWQSWLGLRVGVVESLDLLLDLFGGLFTWHPRLKSVHFVFPNILFSGQCIIHREHLVLMSIS